MKKSSFLYGTYVLPRNCCRLLIARRLLIRSEYRGAWRLRTPWIPRGSNLTILGLGALCARLISLSPLIQGRFSIHLSQFRRRLPCAHPRFLLRSALQLLRPARAAVFSRCFDDNWWDWRGSSYRRRRSCQGILSYVHVRRTNIVFRARAHTTTAPFWLVAF